MDKIFLSKHLLKLLLQKGSSKKKRTAGIKCLNMPKILITMQSVETLKIRN